jgi:hypothetical protein
MIIRALWIIASGLVAALAVLSLIAAIGAGS